MIAARSYAQPSVVAESRFWRPDGPVNAILVTNDTIYLGGKFSYIGPSTGSAGVIDTTTVDIKAGFPRVEGIVYSSAPDGAGGWYLGGAFTSVGGLQRSNLVHVLADNTVDPIWVPRANASNMVIRVSGNTVYVGGGFTRIGGTTRNRLAALDAVTGQPTAWDPNAGGGAVATMAVSGNLMYVGGNFTTIGGQNRARIAAVDLSTGLATTWNPGAAAAVNTLEVSGNTVYIGGAFLTAGARPRNRIAALSVTDNLALDWNPNANGVVNRLAVAGDTVFAGGSFGSIGSQTRTFLAALDATTALATAWAPALDGAVQELLVLGNDLYVGGTFSLVGTEDRRGIVAFDITTGEASAWKPQTAVLAGGASVVTAISRSGTNVLLGGNFNSAGGVIRRNAAALDPLTGRVTEWIPDPNNTVTALAFADERVFLGGLFTSIGGRDRRRVASVNPTNGAAGGWSPAVLGRATTLAINSLLPAPPNLIYIGGNFTNVAGTPRNGLAAVVRTSTGSVEAWNPNPLAANVAQSASVNALALSDNLLYVGGDFISIGGQPRAKLAAVDTTTALASAFKPGVSNVVLALAISGNTLYVGGTLTNIGGQVRGRIAAVDTTTSLATPWNPDASGAGTGTRVNAVSLAANAVYAAGNFTSIGGDFRNRAAALRFSNSQATGWSPNIDNTVRSVLVTGDAIYLGGISPRSAEAGRLTSPCLARHLPSFQVPRRFFPPGCSARSSGPVKAGD